MRVTASNPSDRLTPWLRPSWIEQRPGFPERSVVADDAFDSATVVASAQGVAITESQLLHSVAFAEFLAGHCFEGDERTTIVGATLEEFDADPHEVAGNLLDIAAAVARIPDLSPIVRARLRTQSLTRIVALEAQLGGPPSPTMAVVYRYNPVTKVAADGSVVVMDDAIAAWGRMRAIVSDTAGHDQQWNEASFRTELDEAFDEWPVLQQQAVAEAHPALVATMIGLRRLDEDQREQFADAMAEQASHPAAVESAAIALGTVSRVSDLIAAVQRALVGDGEQHRQN